MTLRAPIPLPDPPLAAGPLVLRPWQPGEGPSLAAAWRDPDVGRWTGVPDQRDEEAAERWIRGCADRRARGLALDLVIDVGGQVAGEVGLAHIDPGAGTAEIGWWVGPGWRGRGLATASARLLACWAVEELNVEAVVARCSPANPPSEAVARAAGFEPVGQRGGERLWRYG